MRLKRAITTFVGVIVVAFLAACGNTSSTEPILEVGARYTARGGGVIIDVNEGTSWTISLFGRDFETNHTIANVSETGETIGDMPVIEIVAEEEIGDIGYNFTTKEGIRYLYVQDEDVVYLMSIRANNKNDIEEAEENDNLEELIRENPSFRLVRQED